jgi:hypothetical protein
MSFLPCAKGEEHHDHCSNTSFMPQKTARHSPPTHGTGSHSLQLCPSPFPMETHLGWVPRRSGDGLVVMEDNEDQIPVTIEEMPAEPWYRVGSEDEGQDT